MCPILLTMTDIAPTRDFPRGLAGACKPQAKCLQRRPYSSPERHRALYVKGRRLTSFVRLCARCCKSPAVSTLFIFTSVGLLIYKSKWTNGAVRRADRGSTTGKWRLGLLGCGFSSKSDKSSFTGGYGTTVGYVARIARRRLVEGSQNVDSGPQVHA